MLTEKSWRIEAVLIFLGMQLGCIFTGAVVIGLLDQLGVKAFNLKDGFGAVVLSTLSFQGATWALIAFFLWFYGTDWRDFFGLRDRQRWRALGMALIAVAILLPVLWEMQMAVTELFKRLHWKVDEETAVQLMESTKTLGGRVYMVVFAVVMAPVAEEFIFRGMLFPFVKQLGFPRLAWVGVSLLFAAIHLDGPTFLPLFVLALTLTWLYVKTGHLLAPITAHALFNAVNVVFLLRGDS